MKFLSLLSIVLLMFCSCKKSNSVPAEFSMDIYTIQVDTLYIEDGPKQVSVEFTNSGDVDLSVFEVSSSCDCVKAVEIPDSPIKGHKSGKIKFSIDVSNYTPSDFNQTVYVTTNTFNSPTPITFTGVVRSKQHH